MEKPEKTEKTEKAEQSIEHPKLWDTDATHLSILDFYTDVEIACDNMQLFKSDLLKVRESKNVSVRESQKVLTTLCKTINALVDFKTYLKETAYNKEHASEIHEEKRALRDFIKSASPEQMKKFRTFLRVEDKEEETK